MSDARAVDAGYPSEESRPATNDINVSFLSEREQTGEQTALKLASFISAARYSLDIAIYDFRLSPPLRGIVERALRERAQAGVSIRIAYDADKPETPDLLRGQDPAESGTGAFVQSLGYPYRRIGGLKLMHQKYVVRDARAFSSTSVNRTGGKDVGSDMSNKYIVRDAGLESAAVWTGSTNFTDDSWAIQDNNILQLGSADLAGYYARDFGDLWEAGNIGTSGSFDPDPVQLSFAGQPATVQALFSPGRGPAIDYEVGLHVARARRRVRICSMLLNSSALISALSDQLRDGPAEVSGIYDQTQMQSVLQQWEGVPHNRWKIPAIRDIVAAARLVGKRSTPYAPDAPHDFMHDKVLVVDDTVITGSYNFSHSAELNAENLVIIESRALADAYGAYIDHLMEKYAADNVGDIGA